LSLKKKNKKKNKNKNGFSTKMGKSEKLHFFTFFKIVLKFLKKALFSK